MMEAESTFETLANFYQTALRDNQKTVTLKESVLLVVFVKWTI
jgi:hypothetical protein